ncbi:MAG: hypothetical protein Ct9H300mP8_08490 [Gammaproteobacteria bacterium]|nr:MAG: hypothetical protein Ct9H300mP8_08490 [Gammaproteobacteria bacterium]
MPFVPAEGARHVVVATLTRKGAAVVAKEIGHTSEQVDFGKVKATLLA